MEVKTREEILRELIERAGEYPTGWKAATRRDPESFGEEYYIFHPKAGVYEVKEYPVNPFRSSGVGAHLTPSVPSGLPRLLKEQPGTFGILEVDLAKFLRALQETPDQSITHLDLSEDVGIRIPMRGPSHRASSTIRSIDASLAKKCRVVDEEFRKLLDRHGVTRAYS